MAPPSVLDLSRLLRPRSIAAIGGAAAAETIRQCRRMGYAGRLYAVHPRHATIEGTPSYPHVDALPEAPDAAFVGVNREASVAVVADLAVRGAGGAVCYASGFSETGPAGVARQTALVEAAGAMPVLGPNCYGHINYLDGALLWPDQHGGRRRERGVAIILQSGNIAINLTMGRHGLPLAQVITLGNQAQVGVAEAVQAVAADPRITAIGLLIEGFGDIGRFGDAVAAAQAAGKPVIALKAGRSEAGAGLALSHTASLGGAARLASALLTRLGVAELETLPAFLASLAVLHTLGPLPGRRVASLSSSGGEAILMADAGARSSVRFPPFAPQRQAAIEATVSALVTVSNPFDYHTFMWGDADAMTETFAAVMAAEVDVTSLVLDLPRADRCDDRLWRPSLEALLRAQVRTGARAALIATLPDGLPEDVAERCLAAGVAPLVGLDPALAAIETAAWLHAAATGTGPAHDRPRPVPLCAGESVLLSEPQAKARLATYGVAPPAGRVVPTEPHAAVAAADALGYPVVAKAVAADMAHKSDAGGVWLNLATAHDVARAAERLAPLARSMLVERMIGDGVAEVLVGYRRDPALGGFLVLGSGGILVELVGDSAVLPLPVTPEEARDALTHLRVAQLIDGYRGKPAGDLDAVAEAAAALGRFCADHADRLAEFEVNPLIVRPAGLGVVAVDALIRTIEPPKQDATREVFDE